MKIKIRTLTPLSITFGEKYSREEYFIYNNILYRIDIGKFFNILNEKERREYVEMIKQLTNKIKMSRDISKMNLGIFDEFYKSYLNTNNKNWIKYKLPIKVNPRNAEISECIKNPITFEPYIPGSSLKGAIRTGIIGYILLKNQELLNKVEDLISKYLNCVKISRLNKKMKLKADFFQTIFNVLLSTEDTNFLISYLEEYLNELLKYLKNNYNKSKVKKLKKLSDTYNDFMKYIQISDFVLLHKKQVLYLPYVVRMSITKRKQEIRLYEEYIMSDTHFEGDIALTPDFFRKKHEIKNEYIKKEIISENETETIRNILKMNFEFYNHILSKFNERFKLDVISSSNSILRLGKNKGMLFTTFLHLFDKHLVNRIIKTFGLCKPPKKKSKIRVDITYSNCPRTFTLVDEKPPGFIEVIV